MFWIRFDAVLVKPVSIGMRMNSWFRNGVIFFIEMNIYNLSPEVLPFSNQTFIHENLSFFFISPLD